MIDTEYLHTYFYGIQDKFLEEEFPKSKYTFVGEYISTETFKIKSPDDLSKGTKIQLTDDNSHLMNYGYSNIQLLDKYCDMIDSITILIGGSIINTIYPHINGATRVLEFADDNTILPAFSMHSIDIVVRFNREGTFELTTDKMKITNPVENGRLISILLKQTLYNGVESIQNEHRDKINFGYKHPIKKITIIAEDDVEYNTTLRFCSTGFDSENADFHYKASSSNGKCIYEFKNTINFTRMDKAQLFVETNKPTNLHIIAEDLYIMCICNGMADMRFSD